MDRQGTGVTQEGGGVKSCVFVTRNCQLRDFFHMKDEVLAPQSHLRSSCLTGQGLAHLESFHPAEDEAFGLLFMNT